MFVSEICLVFLWTIFYWVIGLESADQAIHLDVRALIPMSCLSFLAFVIFACDTVILYKEWCEQVATPSRALQLFIKTPSGVLKIVAVVRTYVAQRIGEPEL